MPSIRRSLVIYVPLLFGVAIAGVGLLVDQLAGDALGRQQTAERDRLEQEYKNRTEDARQKFNAELLVQAQNLAREMRQKYALLMNDRAGFNDEWRKVRTQIGVMQLSPAGGPLGVVNVTLVASNPGFQGPVFVSSLNDRRASELIRDSFDGDDHPGVFQFHLPRTFQPGRQILRPTRQPFSLPLDTDALDRNPQWVDDTHETQTVEAAGQAYQRVVLKAPMLTFRQGGPPPRDRDRDRAGGDRPASRPAGPPPPPPERFPSLYVQFARPLADLAAQLADHAAERDAALAKLDADTATALGRLRLRLVSIAGAAFLALAVGGWVLVGRGLRPLSRLSEAVGRVSERDFRLPVAPADLSTELAPIHARLTGTLDQLKAAFEREKQAVADISHELRTPVAALLATIDVSLRKPRTADQYKQTLQDCRGITKQLGTLVERVMTLAYLDAGQAKVSTHRVAAGELVHECAAVIRPLAEAHGLTFHADADEELDLDTDPGKLREVLMNLLHNAVEYNRPGGRVALCVTRAGGRAVFAVTDTGIGMPADVRAKIFERFYRADPSRTQTGVHAGLGLAIVKEYVDRLGGTIGVESEPGEGSTFRVELPAVAVGELAAA